MANWMFIGFTVAGELSELDRFKSMMFRTETYLQPEDEEGGIELEVIFDFNCIIPSPSDLPPLEHQHWCAEHWGTIWNACHLELLKEDEHQLGFQFQTAWDFPLPVFKALAKEFPSLIFRGSAFENNEGLEYLGEFNGKDDWGPGKIDWGEDPNGDDDDDDDDLDWLTPRSA